MNEALAGTLMRNIDAALRTTTGGFWLRYAKFGRAFQDWRERQRDRVFGRVVRRREWELRQQEERYARATDLQDLERMERAFDRRDAGGVRDWEWR
jgi:hypothetical protein